jgi:hypothetical protein
MDCENQRLESALKQQNLLDALQISRISSLEDTQISSNPTRLTYIIKFGSDCIFVYQKAASGVELMRGG